MRHLHDIELDWQLEHVSAKKTDAARRFMRQLDIDPDAKPPKEISGFFDKGLREALRKIAKEKAAYHVDHKDRVERAFDERATAEDWSDAVRAVGFAYLQRLHDDPSSPRPEGLRYGKADFIETLATAYRPGQ